MSMTEQMAPHKVMIRNFKRNVGEDHAITSLSEMHTLVTKQFFSFFFYMPAIKARIAHRRNKFSFKTKNLNLAFITSKKN